ncbi:MAG TPA: 16S rRNA (cytidine(1402)-2'-O)-methyltransferase [Spongiibacteraceae bacterium]
MLYVVATPIGNLGDMVPRAVSVLQSVSLIAAEDTRHSRRLLDHFNITTRCIAYHDHSSPADLAVLLDELQQGRSVALISDAGTPLISDPGYRLIDAALSADICVVPIPGPCAVITALSAAGLPTDRFVFEGFLPAKSAARRQRLHALLRERRTLVFYEAPHRLFDTLQDLLLVFGGDRIAVLARELTKLHETIHRAPLRELHAWASANQQDRGECVLLLRGDESEQAIDAEAERVLRILLEELSVKQASVLAAKITGLKKNDLYQQALVWQNTE